MLRRGKYFYLNGARAKALFLLVMLIASLWSVVRHVTMTQQQTRFNPWGNNKRTVVATTTIKKNQDVPYSSNQQQGMRNNQDDRYQPSKEERAKAWDLLEKLDIYPRCILDIGANRGDWTRQMLRHYPKSDFILFEANPGHFDASWKDLRQRSNIRWHMGILGDANHVQVPWYSRTSRRMPHGSTGDSMFQEATKIFETVKPRMRNTTRLDTILQSHYWQQEQRQTNFCRHVDFIKLDVQGAELAILQGGPQALSMAHAIQMELPFFGQYNRGAPRFHEYIAFMDQNGFVPYELLNPPVRIGKQNFSVQADFLFVKSFFQNVYNASLR